MGSLGQWLYTGDTSGVQYHSQRNSSIVLCKKCLGIYRDAKYPRESTCPRIPRGVARGLNPDIWQFRVAQCQVQARVSSGLAFRVRTLFPASGSLILPTQLWYFCNLCEARCQVSLRRSTGGRRFEAIVSSAFHGRRLA